MHWQQDPGDKGAELLLAEDDHERQLSLTGHQLKEGAFTFRYGLPPRPTGVRNKLFVTNRSGQAFAIDELKLEVMRYLEPGKGNIDGSAQ